MTGSVASMGLALAVGRGDTPLARLAGPAPLVRSEDVALIGRRDEGQSYGHEALAVSGILDLPWAAISPDGRRPCRPRSPKRHRPFSTVSPRTT